MSGEGWGGGSREGSGKRLVGAGGDGGGVRQVLKPGGDWKEAVGESGWGRQSKLPLRLPLYLPWACASGCLWALRVAHLGYLEKYPERAACRGCPLHAA